MGFSFWGSRCSSWVSAAPHGEGVEKALDEFDEIGRTAFLAKYEFGESKSHYIVREGNQYDAKAIVGAAHGHSGEDWKPLTNHDFKSGEMTTARLEKLGFTLLENRVEQLKWQLLRTDWISLHKNNLI